METGDKGQRYEVRAKDANNKEIIIGWAESLDAAESFCNAIKKHPTMHSPKIIDRTQNTNGL
jgi:hypothetical protein